MARKMPRQKPGESEQVVQTPPEFMQAVEALFGPITFDLAALPSNAQSPNFFTPEVNSLVQDWTALLGNLWLNPEFGDIDPWAEKSADSAPFGQSQRRIFMLVPAAVGTQWWKNHVHQKGLVLFLSPRVRFVGHKQGFPKDLALVIYGEQPGYDLWPWKVTTRVKQPRKPRRQAAAVTP